MEIHNVIPYIKDNLPELLWGSWKLIEPPIGTGSFSVVYRAEAKRLSGTDISAVKIEPIIADVWCKTKKDVEENIEPTLKRIDTEIQIMKDLQDCPYIVNYQEEQKIDMKIDGKFQGYLLCIRMEFLDCVQQSIRQSKFECSEQNIFKLALEIGHGIKALHDKKYTHRDIKPDNFFISSKSNIYKLGDFNVAKQAMSAHSFAGAEYYMAPEVFKAKNAETAYNNQVDIYSFGICLYQFMNGMRLPLQEGKITSDNAVERRLKGESFSEPKNASPEFAKIIMKACSFEAKDRYQTIDEMLADLKKINPENRKKQDDDFRTVYAGPKDIQETDKKIRNRNEDKNKETQKKPIIEPPKDGGNRNTAIIVIIGILIIAGLIFLFGYYKIFPKDNENENGTEKNTQTVSDDVDSLPVGVEQTSVQNTVFTVNNVPHGFEDSFEEFFTFERIKKEDFNKIIFTVQYDVEAFSVDKNSLRYYGVAEDNIVEVKDVENGIMVSIESAVEGIVYRFNERELLFSCKFTPKKETIVSEQYSIKAYCNGIFNIYNESVISDEEKKNYTMFEISENQ